MLPFLENDEFREHGNRTMRTVDIMGQAPSEPKLPIHVSRMSPPAVKKRRTELDMLSDSNIMESIETTPRKLRHSITTTENAETRHKTSKHASVSRNHVKLSPPSKNDIIRQKDAEIEELRKQNEALQSRLAEIEAKYKEFVPPQGMVPHRKRSGTDDKKTRRPARANLSGSKLEIEDDTPLMTTTYSLYQRPIDASENDEPIGTVEVPSWRILPISGQNISRRETEEATSDEVYLRRHSKLETEERRRKKWDRQWMSEQKRFERARRKQARGNTCQTAPMKDPVLTLFPSGSRLQAVEISENVPVVAWGCAVPSFLPREFSLE